MSKQFCSKMIKLLECTRWRTEALNPYFTVLFFCVFLKSLNMIVVCSYTKLNVKSTVENRTFAGCYTP